MKITICDDSKNDLMKIERLLRQYQDFRSKEEMQVETFADPVKLRDKVQQKEMADIYILDILMSETTGIDLGSQIRKAAKEKVIVYVTSTEDFALDAFEVHAARYLLKPVERDKFFEAMDYAFSCMEMRKTPVYLVKTKEGLVSVPYTKIEYIESASRIQEVHLTDGELLKSIFMRKSFEEEIKDLSKDKNFMQVHKSFLINMEHIKRLDGNCVIMDSGMSVPVSKKNITNVKREYLLFVSQQYR